MACQGKGDSVNLATSNSINRIASSLLMPQTIQERNKKLDILAGRSDVETISSKLRTFGNEMPDTFAKKFIDLHNEGRREVALPAFGTWGGKIVNKNNIQSNVRDYASDINSPFRKLLGK